MLRNYRNYQRDNANRYAAYVNNNLARNAQNQANYRASQVSRDQHRFTGGSPRFSAEHQNQMFSETFPMMEEAQNRAADANFFASEAMNNEMAQVQDRKMDLADNEQGRKNLDTEYNRQIEMEKIAAAERMNNRNNEGLDSLNNSFSGIADGLISDPMQVPNYDLYDNGKKRIGGSYFGNALLG